MRELTISLNILNTFKGYAAILYSPPSAIAYPKRKYVVRFGNCCRSMRCNTVHQAALILEIDGFLITD
jgi:hypothetical protein